MRFGSVFVFTSLFTLSCLIAPACSDDSAELDEDSGTGPKADASRSDSSTDSGVRDAAPDARRDAAADASEEEEEDAATEADAGAADGGAPATGSPCTTTGELFERACGTCGLQSAVCNADLVVGGYGACTERHPSFCEGPIDPDAGTDAGEADAGEADAGIDAGEADAGTDAGQPPVDTWQGYNIDIDFAVGQSTSIALPDTTGQRRRISVIGRQTCPVAYPGTATPYGYALVRLRNTTAQSISLDVSVTRGLGPTDTILAVYAAPPSTDDDFKACYGRADRDSCPDPAGTAGQRLSCLNGTAPVVIPANTSSYAYVTMALTAWNGPGLAVTRR